ncbi:MAG: hypothetical protein GX574_14900 [Lentisphaerae bacterium]|nr:hypothetical protein [Lentisphaerota bacterium]
MQESEESYEILVAVCCSSVKYRKEQITFITNFPLNIYTVNVPKFCCLEAYAVSDEVKLTISENATKPFYSRYQFICSIFSKEAHEVYIIRLGKWFSSVISIISVDTGEQIKIKQDFSGNFLFVDENKHTLARLENSFFGKNQSCKVVSDDNNEVILTKDISKISSQPHGYGEVYMQATSPVGSKIDIRIIIGFIIIDFFHKKWEYMI